MLLLLAIGVTQSTNAQNKTANDLSGTWVIDLPPAPGAAPYLQEMVVSKIDGRGFSGFFYPLLQEWGNEQFLGQNFTLPLPPKTKVLSIMASGYLENGELKGMTYCDKRDFVMFWTGKKKEITK